MPTIIYVLNPPPNHADLILLLAIQTFLIQKNQHTNDLPKPYNYVEIFNNPTCKKKENFTWIPSPDICKKLVSYFAISFTISFDIFKTLALSYEMILTVLYHLVSNF